MKKTFKPARVKSVDFRGGVRGKHYARFTSAPVTVQPDGEAARTIDKAAEYDSSDRVRSNYAARYSDMVAQKRVKRSRKKSS